MRKGSILYIIPGELVQIKVRLTEKNSDIPRQNIPWSIIFPTLYNINHLEDTTRTNAHKTTIHDSVPINDNNM